MRKDVRLAIAWDAELDELERLIGEEEEAHALGGTARGKRGGATPANALLPGGVDTEREERRRKEVLASLERTEAEAPRLQSEHDVDELSRWLVSLARRVDGLKADDDKVMALPHDPRLPPGTHTAASLRLQELDKLQRRVAELQEKRGFSYSKKGQSAFASNTPLLEKRALEGSATGEVIGPGSYEARPAIGAVTKNPKAPPFGSNVKRFDPAGF